MTGSGLLGISRDLEKYLAGYDGLLGRSENRDHFRRFARGQLGTEERKNLESMADFERSNPRTLQFFFSRYRWDEEGVRDRLQQKVSQEFGTPEGIFVIDETSDGKKGRYTAGVARQYCGAEGKVENCIVSVHLAYVNDDFHTLLDGELFLPEEWNPDPDNPDITARRRRAMIPADMVHRSKLEIALEQLKRALGNRIPGRYVSADELYGRARWWREAVAGLGLVYAVEVPCTTQVLLSPAAGQASVTVAEMPEKTGPWHRKHWKAFRVHDTQKGPDVWEVKAGRIWDVKGQAAGTEQWLLIARNVLSSQVKYFLSSAAKDAPLAVLVQVAFSRWHIERCFEDCKGELGLDHSEIRTWVGLQRHFTLTAVNYFFLQKCIRNQACSADPGKKKRRRSYGQPSGGRRAKTARKKDRGNHASFAIKRVG